MIEFNKEKLLNGDIYNNYLKDFAPIDKKVDGYVYLRVSTERQVENSPETQLKDILKYAIENGIFIDKTNIFVDAGISGRTADKRTEFQTLINTALQKNNKCKVVLVHKYDRFARNKEDSVSYEAKLKKAGIKLIAVKQPLSDDKMASLILKSNYEVISEVYSLNLSTEVYKGLIPQAQNGKHMTKPPYGYKKVVKEVIKQKGKDKIIRDMVVREDEANIVKIIFEKFINGMSLLKIAKYLNNLGFKTRDGLCWYDNRIKYILTNITYLGLTHWTEAGKETIIAKGAFPSIINQDTWDKAQEIIKIHSKNSTKTQVKNEHWLRGFIRCNNCNNVLVLNGGSWQCCNYTHGGCKESHSIRIDKMESMILNYLKDLTTEKIVNINLNEIKIQNNNEIAIINQKIEQLENKNKRIMQAYEDEIYTLEEFKERKDNINNELSILKSKIEELKKSEDYNVIKNTICKKCDNAYNILLDENVPVLDKRILMDSIIEKIIYDKKSESIEIYYKVERLS